MIQKKHIFTLLYVLIATTTIASEEGFTSVFNGKDFTGWIGNTNGSRVDFRNISIKEL